AGTLVLWRLADNQRREFPNFRSLPEGAHVAVNSSIDRMLVSSREGYTLWELQLQGTSVQRLEGAGHAQFTNDYKAELVQSAGGAWRAFDNGGSAIGSISGFGRAISFADYQAECSRFLVWTTEGEIFQLQAASAVAALPAPIGEVLKWFL